jgi:hypothetical protein
MTLTECHGVLADRGQAPLDPCRRCKGNYFSVTGSRKARRSQQWRTTHCGNRLGENDRDTNVTVQRLLDIYKIMERYEHETTRGFTLCAVAAEFMALDGAGVALMGDREDLTSLCTSNHAAGALMDLEITLGEGPTTDASRGNSVEDINLQGDSASQWSVYRTEAVALGAQAVFAYPVRLGAIRFGALSLFRKSPGPLSPGQSSDAYLMASVVGRAILAAQAGAANDGLVGELNGASILDFRVHQAAGMLAVQGSMTVKDALVLLRARSFSVGSQLTDLAARVVSGASRFESDSKEWIDEQAGGNVKR